MKLIILCAYLTQYLFVGAAVNTEIENVYIDALIQRYKILENNLWNFIKENRLSEPIVVVDKIITEHQTFFMEKDLEGLMSNVYNEKFQSFYEVKSFKNCSQEDRLLKLLNESHLPSYISDKLSSTDSRIYCVDRVASNYRKKAKKLNEIFGVVLKAAETSNCNGRITKIIESPSQNIFMLYQIMSSSVLIQYASELRYLMVKAVRDGFDETNVEELRDKFNYKYRRIADRAGEYLRISNRDVWMCDPDVYFKSIDVDSALSPFNQILIYTDDTSIQITNFLRGYVDNEINLNVHKSCDRSCSEYKTARQHGCYEGTFCDYQKKHGRKDATCTGQIFDCHFIESDMQICASRANNTRRRYDYIEYDSGRRFGKEPCSTYNVEALSWWKYWIFPCDYCFCYCEEPNKNSNRSFSLHSMVSDIRRNKIITGVGLTSKNGIFSWVITQSKLLSDGRVQQINETTSEEDNVDDDEDELIIQDEFEDISNGIDYHTLTWRNRAMDLATITAPAGSVLTGIRFTVVKNHLTFEIRATQFDFNSGRLYGRSEWISDKMDRSELLLDRPEPSYPIHINDVESKKSVPNFSTNKFMKFRATDRDKDAAQTTVPFIDTQLVRPMYLTLLAGVGIYHKGRPGFGGFVAPKLIIYDMSSYLGI